MKCRDCPAPCAPGRVRCPACLVRRKVWQARWLERVDPPTTPEQLAAQRERMRRLRAQRKEAQRAA